MSHHKENPPMSTCVIYRRESIANDNIERQLADCTALAERHGWTVTEVFTDQGKSAYQLDTIRPDYQRVFAGIKDGSITHVVIPHVDRMWRQPLEFFQVLRVIEPRQGEPFLAQIHAVAGPSLESDADIEVVAGKVMNANTSSRDTSRRVSRDFLDSAENGVPHGSRCFGYAADPENLTKYNKPRLNMLVDEAEAKMFRMVVADLLDGKTLRATTRKLNATGSRTPVNKTRGGNPWQPNDLRRTLLLPRYVGVRVHRGVEYPAQWPAIISREEQAQLSAVLNRNENTRRGAAFGLHLLSGILRCGKCGGRMYTMKNRSATGGRLYVCPSPPKGCAGVSIRADLTDAEVTMAILHGAPAPSTAPSTAPSPVLYVDGKLDALRARRLDMASAYADGKVDLDLFTLTVASLDKQIVGAEQRQADVAEARAAAVHAQSLRNRWTTLDLEEQRKVIQYRAGSITIMPAFAKAPRRYDPRRVVIAWADVEDAVDDPTAYYVEERRKATA